MTNACLHCLCFQIYVCTMCQSCYTVLSWHQRHHFGAHTCWDLWPRQSESHENVFDGFWLCFPSVECLLYLQKCIRLSGFSSRCDSGKVVRKPVMDDQEPRADCWHPYACKPCMPCTQPAWYLNSKWAERKRAQANQTFQKSLLEFINGFR